MPRIPDRARLTLYAQLARLDRPIGALLLLWPTLWALWLAANGTPSLHLLVVFVLGVFLTRSGGCVLNDYADRDLDGGVDRTRDRPLATGRVAPGEALVLAALLFGLAFLLVLTTNRLTVLLSFAGAVLAGIYPFMKRITWVPQFFLGLAFSWGIPMAFAAQTGGVPPVAWLLYMANILWAMVYDTIYAMVDRNDDLRLGVRSTAILFDDADTTIIGIMQIMMLALLTLVGYRLQLGFYYYLGIILAGAQFFAHQIVIRDRSRDACFRAFMLNNWVGLTIFAGIVLAMGMVA
ncbi:MAG: 4-hydroxybenzoate polyprenyltransferase [Gammaproteobacteria bacterium RIFCSPLOWO2_02_FULL_61_13]|nr:MAG: 4-hydroxybenzoate polyprenyltransferase [Gammaproteobacteria bacterium RIFCSPLOWO2_02_FULL_61_13]